MGVTRQVGVPSWEISVQSVRQHRRSGLLEWFGVHVAV